MNLDTSISIKNMRGIHEDLEYKSAEGCFIIAIENTSPRDGWYLSIDQLPKQLSSSDKEKLKLKSKILKELKNWSKSSGTKICW
jgi:hypothetical protein